MEAENNKLKNLNNNLIQQYEVKWAKDIKPVEKEYNKYKKNKERINQIKELFGYMENNNK